jgi:hypothetical protein
MIKQQILSRIGLVGCVLAAGCSSQYQEYQGDEVEPTLGTAQEAVAACAGDDLQYDFNAFAASLAVAIANELGHWDVATDFVVTGGKLALSPVGLSRCSNGCENVKALLLLQEDASSGVPNHSPSMFRTKLSGWYGAQMTKLTELTTAAAFPPGTYRFKGRQSNKFLVVDQGSTTSGAVVEQKSGFTGNNGDWEVSIVGTKHKLKNLKSGLCLDLKTDGPANTDMVQKPCSSAESQLFRMSKSATGTSFLFETRHPGKGLIIAGNSTGEDAKLTQATFDKNQYSSQWIATSLGGTAQQGLFKGMYTFTASNSGKVIGVTTGSEGAGLAQYSYAATNPMQNWYALPMGTNVYQFVNRSTGKCMALATDVATAAIVQKDCANNDSQKFTLTSTGSPDQYTFKSRYGKLLEVKGYTSTDGAVFQQATATAADPQRKFKLTPILAGEPHRLTFSHSSTGAACGDYFWFDIKQPNGLAVANPAETFVQLIFAGGKTSLGGADQNPFIAQQSSGTQVAIDPSGYMNGGAKGASGSCLASDIVYDNAKECGGKCCIKYSGVTGKLVASSWSTTTFLCQ